MHYTTIYITVFHRFRTFETKCSARNSRYNNAFAVKVYQQWANNRNLQPMNMKDRYYVVPEDINNASVDELNFWLSRFIVECRRYDGKLYPSNSLYNIMSGLQRFLREKNPQISFFDKSNADFDDLRKTLDARMKKLTGE